MLNVLSALRIINLHEAFTHTCVEVVWRAHRLYGINSGRFAQVRVISRCFFMYWLDPGLRSSLCVFFWPLITNSFSVGGSKGRGWRGQCDCHPKCSPACESLLGLSLHEVGASSWTYTWTSLTSGVNALSYRNQNKTHLQEFARIETMVLSLVAKTQSTSRFSVELARGVNGSSYW